MTRARTSAPRGLGLIGAGQFGAFLLDSMHDLPGLRVVAVADPDPVAAARLADRYAVPAFTDAAALLTEPRVELVAVSSPPADHAATAVAALAAGRHVFCEKPMGLTVDEATGVAAEARRSGCRLVVDHVLRYNPLLSLLRTLQDTAADGGRLLGPLRRFAVENDASNEGLSDRHWFWDEAVSGGIFVEHGVHFFDACRWLMGRDPARIQALAACHGRPAVTDTVLASAAYTSGATATFLHAFTHARRAEHQLTRLDWGLAEGRIDGWIPVDLDLDIWCGGQGRAFLQGLPGRTAELLAVPGYRPSGREAISVTSTSADARLVQTPTGPQDASYRLRVRASLGGPPGKDHVYAQSVRAAMSDLLAAIECGSGGVDGGQVRAGADEGWHSVAVATAATEAARTGLVVEPALPPAWL